MSDVTDLLDRLAAGTTTLDDVVRDFETRAWPPALSDKKRQDAALRGDDPEPIVEGSFAEVASAYVNGDLDDEQYAALAQAAAKGMGASSEDPGADAAGGPNADPKATPDAPPADDAATPAPARTPQPAAPGVAPKA